jgi:hypothetical protein
VNLDATISGPERGDGGRWLPVLPGLLLVASIIRLG